MGAPICEHECIQFLGWLSPEKNPAQELGSSFSVVVQFPIMLPLHPLYYTDS